MEKINNTINVWASSSKTKLRVDVQIDFTTQSQYIHTGIPALDGIARVMHVSCTLTKDETPTHRETFNVMSDSWMMVIETVRDQFKDSKVLSTVDHINKTDVDNLLCRLLKNETLETQFMDAFEDDEAVTLH